MRSRTKRRSIIGQLTRTTRTIALVLLIPVLASLTIMFVTSTRYQEAMSRMETAASLKPIVGTELPERLFSVAAGQSS